MRQLLQRHWGWVLSLSIAGNIAAGSYWVARTMRHRERVARSHHAERPWRAVGGREGSGARSRRNKAVRPMAWLSRSQRNALRQKHRQLRELRGQAEKTLRAEPFDAPAFERQLGAIGEQMRDVQQTIHQLLSDKARAMSLEERRELAARSWGPGGRRRKGRRHERAQ